MTRTQYETLFAEYPDVVTLPQFCKMLGGIGDSTARKLMRENVVRHFVIDHGYMIPKTCVIDYVMSKHYKLYRLKLKAKLPIRMPKGGNENELP